MPVSAPSYWSTALVEIVVPWKTWATESGAVPLRAQSWAMPAAAPSEGSSAVVGTLWIALSRVSLSVMMRSVKVPPTSTPISFMGRPLALAAQRPQVVVGRLPRRASGGRAVSYPRVGGSSGPARSARTERAVRA